MVVAPVTYRLSADYTIFPEEGESAFGWLATPDRMIIYIMLNKRCENGEAPAVVFSRSLDSLVSTAL
jgi:hypothetical protein